MGKETHSSGAQNFRESHIATETPPLQLEPLTGKSVVEMVGIIVFGPFFQPSKRSTFFLSEHHIGPTDVGKQDGLSLITGGRQGDMADMADMGDGLIITHFSRLTFHSQRESTHRKMQTKTDDRITACL